MASEIDLSEAIPDSYIVEKNEEVEAFADPIEAPGKAIVGQFRRGPINEAVEVESWGHFVSVFGGFFDGSDSPDHVYAYYKNAQFDMKGKLWIVRVAHLVDYAVGDTNDTVKASVLVPDGNAVKATIIGTVETPVDIVGDTSDGISIFIDGSENAGQLTPGVGVEATTIVEEINAILVGGGLAEAFTPDGATVGIRLLTADATTTLQVTGTAATLLGISGDVVTGTAGANTLKFEAIDGGVWGNNLSVDLSYNENGTMNIVVSGDQRVESFSELELVESHDDPTLKASFYLSKVNNSDRSVGSRELRVSFLPTTPLGDDVSLHPVAGVYALVNGSDGTAVDNDDFVGSADYGTGIQAMGSVDKPLDFICPEKEAVTSFIQSALNLGKNSLNRNFVFCYEKSLGFNGAISQRDTEAWNTSYGSSYWLQIQLDYNGKDLSGSGVILGQYEKSDRLKGVYQSPSGIDMKLVGCRKIYTIPTETQAGKMNAKSVNFVYSFEGKGTVIWGGRTLYQGKKWRYIVSRRDMIVIEHNLKVDGRSAVHRNNDENLWSSLYRNGKAQLDAWWKKGGLTGKSASQAYFIKCDSETTTKTQIDDGIVRRIVKVKVPKIAEFIVTIIDQKV